MSGYPDSWALCGGWGVDAWLGRTTRPHGDVDLAVFADGQRAILEYFGGWELIAHDDHVEDNDRMPWTGRRVGVPGHIHARSEGIELDLQLNERRAGMWVLNHEPLVALPLDASIARTRWQLPVAAPEVILFYKALAPGWRGARTPPRPQDETDLATLQPLLSAAQRRWLSDSIAAVSPEHPWRVALTSS